MGWFRLTAICLAMTGASACSGGGNHADARPPGPLVCTPRSGTTITTVEITTTDDIPLLVTAPPDDGRLFVVEREGAIEIVDETGVRSPPFLDLDDSAGGPVEGDGEMGLLGMAFHPDYRTNRKFYVYYTTDEINDVVAEYETMESDPNRADPSTARIILSIPDFAGNHNGGMIEFGSDGYLYIATGDGGGAGDPQRTAQDRDRLLGKILRIDVDNPDGGRAYGIPSDNPYAAGGGAPEVYIRGLRNPWRWSFDSANGDLYIGDVGQEAVEEIDVISAADAPDADFGWSDCEGTLDYYGSGCNAPAEPGRHRPVYEEIREAGGGNSNWNSVIGGEVYRGECFTDLTGLYFFSDNAASGIWTLRYANGVATEVTRHDVDVPGAPSFIHRDGFGELYVGFGNGAIHRIEVE
jgi:glucose/arabinose dehydrogenase